MKLAGRISIVTGAAQGIGAAIAREFAREGAIVAALDRKAEVGKVCEEIGQAGGKASAHVLDITDQESYRSCVEQVASKFGRIDALVNNAAIGPLGTILETPEELWDRVVDVNLKGMYLTCKAVLPAMIRQGGGSIVNIGSGAGWGKLNMFAYASSKGGVFALSTALAYDFFNQRIRVNVVVPGGGGIPTGMSVGRVGGDMERLTRDARGSAAGRHVTGEDVARVVAFLLTPDAETISGTVIDVGCFAYQGGPIPKP